MLKLSFLISSHALESRFFGIAAADFRTEDLAAGGPEVVVWEDVRCHTARGLPKVSLVAVQGSVTQEGGDFPVWALLRQRGRRLPPDEIIQRKDLGDASGAWLAITATTTATRLQVSIKLLARPCPLESP